MPGELILFPGSGNARIPTLFRDAGQRGEFKFVEFFTANIRNTNTRTAYARAVGRFARWCEEADLALHDLTALHVAAYIEQLGRQVSKPSVKQHLAAIRMLFDFLVVGQVVSHNPAASVRGPRYSIKKGKTPVLTREEARHLFDSIDVGNLAGLRDRALLAVMVYSFARIGAVLGMQVEDYYQQGRRSWLRLHEKGGKDHEVPAHHKIEEYLDGYLKAAEIAEQKGTPLFRSLGRGRGRRITTQALHPGDALAMVKRRSRQAGLGDRLCCHSFRATGITCFLEAGGSLEQAQKIASHESTRTTQLYDRTSDILSLDEIERIRL